VSLLNITTTAQLRVSSALLTMATPFPLICSDNSFQRKLAFPGIGGKAPGEEEDLEGGRRFSVVFWEKAHQTLTFL